MPSDVSTEIVRPLPSPGAAWPPRRVFAAPSREGCSICAASLMPAFLFSLMAFSSALGLLAMIQAGPAKIRWGRPTAGCTSATRPDDRLQRADLLAVPDPPTIDAVARRWRLDLGRDRPSAAPLIVLALSHGTAHRREPLALAPPRR